MLKFRWEQELVDWLDFECWPLEPRVLCEERENRCLQLGETDGTGLAIQFVGRASGTKRASLVEPFICAHRTDPKTL